MSKQEVTASIDFKGLNSRALRHMDAIIKWILPVGKREGAEWVALNPRRSDMKLGSFKVNVVTGRWADFASNDRGGDVISLVAFLRGVRQVDAANLLAKFLGGSRNE